MWQNCFNNKCLRKFTLVREKNPNFGVREFLLCAARSRENKYARRFIPTRYFCCKYSKNQITKQAIEERIRGIKMFVFQQRNIEMINSPTRNMNTCFKNTIHNVAFNFFRSHPREEKAITWYYFHVYRTVRLSSNLEWKITDHRDTNVVKPIQCQDELTRFGPWKRQNDMKSRN